MMGGEAHGIVVLIDTEGLDSAEGAEHAHGPAEDGEPGDGAALGEGGERRGLGCGGFFVVERGVGGAETGIVRVGLEGGLGLRHREACAS